LQELPGRGAQAAAARSTLGLAKWAGTLFSYFEKSRFPENVREGVSAGANYLSSETTCLQT
jgi:hypothetical protein